MGRSRARKVIYPEQGLPVCVKHAATEHVPALEGDSGQVETLPDGSMSIPVLEEQLWSLSPISGPVPRLAGKVVKAIGRRVGCQPPEARA